MILLILTIGFEICITGENALQKVQKTFIQLQIMLLPRCDKTYI